MTVLWTPGARADLFAIDDHLANDNPAVAATILDRSLDMAGRLKDHPGIGRPNRKAGTRELVISGSRYLMVYRVHRDTVQILRVLHGARKWP